MDSTNTLGHCFPATWLPFCSDATIHGETEAAEATGCRTGVSSLFRIFIGVVEILVAIGLNLPGLTGILTWLTPLAAAGLMIVMIGVVILHLKHQEWTSMIGSGVIFLLVTFVAYGRFFVVPYSDWAQIKLD